MKVNNMVAVIYLLAFIFVILGCRLGQSLESNLMPTPTVTSISTVTLAATATPMLSATSNSAPTITATPIVASPIVLMAYPDHENCTIQVDTQDWKISDLWKKNIIGWENNAINKAVPVSNKLLVYLIEHQIYSGCRVAWAPGVGFENSEIQVSLETINNKEWEIWNIGNNGTRVYFFAEIKDVRFMQLSPPDIPQQQGCTEDVYKIIESLSCK